MVARGKAHTFSLTQQTSSPQAAQLKFFIYEGTDALGNTVEVSSLAKMVLTARVFSKAKLNKDQRSTERALVCTAFLVEGRWLGTLFEGSLFEEVDSQIKANASAGSEEVCEIRKVG